MKRLWFSVLLVLLVGQLLSQSPLDRSISISVDKQPLEQVLFDLMDKSNVNLSFSNTVIPKDKLVTIQAVNQGLGSVLDKILDGTQLSYEVLGSLIVLINKKTVPALRRFKISGYVRDEFSGEWVIGAVIFEGGQVAGTYTNDFGFYSITLKEGAHKLIASYFGYKPDTIPLELNSNLEINFTLKPEYLQQVEVYARADSAGLETKGLGSVTLHVNHIQKMAGLGGEVDVMRAAFNLPGIQTGAGGFGGISVRGGNIDQNNYMLDGVTVYNATHGLGIFSIYNGSAIKSAHLLKGNFPAKYGGRISSIWDIQTKDGNFNQYQGEVDLGVSSAKVSVEGPMAKGDGSFFLSGRRSLFDLYSVPITKYLRRKKGVSGQIGYYFYDFNLKLNHQVSRKDRVFLSYYRGLDDFKDTYQIQRSFRDTLAILSDNDRVLWGNSIGAFRWSHQFKENLFGNATISFSRYFYESQDLVDIEIYGKGVRLTKELLFLKYSSDIQDFTIKTDFDYNISNGHRLKYGASYTRHLMQPGIVFFDQASAVDTIQLDTLGKFIKEPLRSSEFDAYFQDEMIIGKNLHANLGLRLSIISSEGGLHISPQPRIQFNLFPQQDRSFTLALSKMTQNLHLLSPTSIGLPKDLWVSSTKRVKPQQSWQMSSGISQKMGKDLELNVEAFYKTMRNLLIFKGTILEEVNSVNWQEKISTGNGKSHGIEFLLKKNSEKIGGWLSYSLTWTERKFDKEINKGLAFPYRLDRRHSLSIQSKYKINETWTIAAGMQVASGSAYTFPVQEYELVQAPGQPPTDIIIRPRVIDQLNGERLPTYHRLDISADYAIARGKVNQTLRFGAYNVYNRKNPLYITVRDKFSDNGEIQKEAVQVSLLPFFPTLRYVLEFR